MRMLNSRTIRAAESWFGRCRRYGRDHHPQFGGGCDFRAFDGLNGVKIGRLLTVYASTVENRSRVVFGASLWVNEPVKIAAPAVYAGGDGAWCPTKISSVEVHSGSVIVGS